MLAISHDQTVDFCQRLMAESEDVFATAAAMSALELFITEYAEQADNADELKRILSVITVTKESCHQQMQEKYRQDMLAAIRQCNIVGLTASFAVQPREGFLQLLQQLIAELSDDDIRLLMLWSENWIKEAGQLPNDEINQDQLSCMQLIDRLFNAV
ncbi:MAG: hypothetical protein OEY36_06540 [Gammaproteobacteria bacterium]|nr:hypothetical protein [Gammaproteobacteria bacterium]